MNIQLNMNQFRMGVNQIRNLKKIRAFVSNSSLKDLRQSDIRSKCLQLWEVSIFCCFFVLENY